MNAPPRISVVIPAYNAVNTIRVPLESVVNQTVPVHETIVVDDGSHDETVRFVQQNFPQVRLLTQTNAGPAAARNHGVRAATGDWIAFLDADDSWLPHKLERQVKEIAENVGLIHTHTVGDKGKNERDLNFAELWQHNYIGTSTVLINKAVFDAVGGFIEDRILMGVEDYNLWMRVAATGQRIVTVREELAFYTPAEGNLSGQVPRIVRAELLNIELLERLLHIAPEKMKEKRIAILDEYSRALFWMRDLALARKYYRELLQLQFNARNAGFWLATFLPLQLLNRARRTTLSKNETLLQAATMGLSR